MVTKFTAHRSLSHHNNNSIIPNESKSKSPFINKQITNNKSTYSPPAMPISNHHRRRHQNLLLFILKCAVMFAVISLFLFFLGFAAFVLLHFIFIPNNNNRRRQNQTYVETQQQILPDVVYTQSAFKDSSESCAICLDCFKEGDVSWFLPDCSHLFHARCVDRWIFKRPTCPVCRTRVSLDDSTRITARAKARARGVHYGDDDDDHWKRLWTNSASSYN